MVPCANLIGFAGQELSRKLPKVFGILIETTLGSVVEIILFMVLLNQDQFAVIQAARWLVKSGMDFSLQRKCPLDLFTINTADHSLGGLV